MKAGTVLKEDVAQNHAKARILHERGLSYAEIGRRLGLSRTWIRRVCLTDINQKGHKGLYRKIGEYEAKIREGKMKLE